MNVIEGLRQLFVLGVDKATFYLIRPHRLFLNGMDKGYKETITRPSIVEAIIFSLVPFAMLAFYVWQCFNGPGVWWLIVFGVVFYFELLYFFGMAFGFWLVYLKRFADRRYNSKGELKT